VRLSSTFYKDLKNQRELLDSIGSKLGVQKLEDWYSISVEQVRKNGGTTLMNKHTTLLTALKELYPDHPWDGTKFIQQVPKGYWLSIENQRQYVNVTID
jgi:hypothetical protein